MMHSIQALGRRLNADQSGQALAEFALIMPILFLLIAGILGFGRAYNIQQVLVDATREGARVGAVQNTSLTDSTAWVNAVKAAVTARLGSAGVRPSDITAINVIGKWSGGHDSLHVDARVRYSLPLLSVLMNWAVGTPNFTLRAATTMRNEK